MDLLDAIIWASLVGTPTSIGIAWWLWFRYRSLSQKKWRTVMMLTGLLSSSANACLYYAWLIYRLVAGGTPLVWRLKDVFGDIGGWVVLLALVGAVLGKGASRIPVAISAVLGLIFWVRIGIL